jgi:hypothetical protein
MVTTGRKRSHSAKHTSNTTYGETDWENTVAIKVNRKDIILSEETEYEWGFGETLPTPLTVKWRASLEGSLSSGEHVEDFYR